MHHLRKKVTDFLNRNISKTTSHDMTTNRKKTIVFRSSIIVVLVIVIVLGFQFFDILKLKAASFGWVQNNWSGGASSDVATHTNNQTGWTKFFSKDSNVDTSGGEVKLTGTSNAAVDTTDTDFNAGTKTNVVTLGTGAGASVTLLKQDGATCSVNSECASGGCQAAVCVPACSGSIASGQFCAFGGLVYGVVTAADGNLWLDRNLGATEVATASNDVASYGWYFQWGRAADGHQLKDSPITSEISFTSTVAEPDTGKFISTNDHDWLSPSNDNLWQGVNGINNPCPPGFRVPAQADWFSVVSALNIPNCANDRSCAASVSASSLKVPLAGCRDKSSASVQYFTEAYYWTSSSAGMPQFAPYFVIDPRQMVTYYGDWPNSRSFGFSVRCIKN